METSFDNMNTFDSDDNVDLKQEVSKFLRYWPWFIITLVFTLVASYI